MLQHPAPSTRYPYPIPAPGIRDLLNFYIFMWPKVHIRPHCHLPKTFLALFHPLFRCFRGFVFTASGSGRFKNSEVIRGSNRTRPRNMCNALISRKLSQWYLLSLTYQSLREFAIYKNPTVAAGSDSNSRVGTRARLGQHMKSDHT
jgi:hypothetical protein